ncbi:protein tesmin/TSO1-like CXC 2 [Euphorbia lathyris]|uniref:protein tesmin/TSO1-like CXC 2 n=1 Tax=Euphorbia lathyris TaxID=212925 RepID=UPI003313C098
MDSPEPAKTTSTAAAFISTSVTASSDSPVQESPFSNYISSLSPINPVKAAHVPQGFLGLSSPPLVFTSPRNILNQRTSFLQRSQLSHISSLEIPEKDDGSKKLDDLSHDLKEAKTYCRTLIDDTHGDNDIRNNMQDQPGSLSGCADEYLNDSGDVDCINSASPVDQNVKQSNDILQSSISSLSNANSDDKYHTRAEVDTSSALSGPTKEDLQRQSSNEIKPVYIEEEQTGSKHPPNESGLSIDHDPEINQSDALERQASEEYVENMKTTLQGSVQNVAQCDLEVNQLQRGLSRRCLQFEEAGRKTNVRRIPSSNQTDSSIGSVSLTSATEMESLGSTRVDLTASSNKKQMLNLSQLANSVFPPRSTGKSHMVVPKPSGIGLHLNSVALPMGSHISVAIIKSTPTTDSHHVDNKGYSEKLSKLIEKVAIAPEDGMSEPLSSLAAAPSESCQTVKPLDTIDPIDHATSLNKRKVSLEHADNFEELSQLSPTKKKRQTSSSADGDGCKRCNCKKTKCLKLYCDCFAAGIYCAESCACQGCFNKPEYENTVLETRQLIESRNPLAFAPKVVQHVAERAAVNKEGGSRKMPSLARHKKGCNCKKSMCLKKYCECYQANVGCSSECRCEGCRNSYGRKEEYHSSEEILHNRVCKEILGHRGDHKLGMVATDKGPLQGGLQDPHSLTPSTPSFHHSDHGKDAAKSRLNSSTHVPSPESDISNLPSYTNPIRSPITSLSNDMIPEGNEDILDIDSFGQEMDYNVSEMMDQFSPRGNALADICDLTSSQNSIATLASSASSNTKGCVSGSRLQLCSGSSQFSSGRSLRWRSSPITPMPQLGETKNQDHDSDSGLYDILGDETPEILKEASTPIPSLKATSPNKKRVSPPHNHVHGIRPSSAVGLRSGRKFILTAISSSPSLTPCDQSKGKTFDKSSNK